MKNNLPYIIVREDPRIKQFEPLFEQVAQRDKSGIGQSILPECVDKCDTYYSKDLIMSLQHFPERIADFVFGLQYEFMETADGDIIIPCEEWKKQDKYALWFYALGGKTFMPLFIANPYQRFLSLFGDMAVKYHIDTAPDNYMNSLFALDKKIPGMIKARIFKACVHFFMYPPNEEYNPEPAIIALINEYKLPNNIVAVKARAYQNIRTGRGLKLDLEEN